MLEASVQSLGSPGSFDITDKDDPLYYIARASHEESLQYYAMQQQGFKYRQEETSDITTIQSSLEGYLTSFASWLDGAVASQEAGTEIAALPAIPSLPGLPMLNLILPILIRVGIRILEIYLRKRLDPDTDTQELVTVLRKALMHNPGESNEFPILDLLANQPIELMVNTQNEQYDVAFVPSVHSS